MAAYILISGTRLISRRTLRRPAVSLVELLVVLFIMGIMLSLLLPALSGARNKANDVKCMNNLRQVRMALSRSITTMKKFPSRNRWTIDSLRWMEEVPLYDAIKNNANPNAEYGRPPLFYCPMQEDFPSRVAAVGFCHVVLVVDRPDDPHADRRRLKDVKWEVMDRQLLAEDPEKPEEPWYIGPEMSFVLQAAMLANEAGPHTAGKYMTSRGELVP
jgi:type II secretory pathway pseudopilin PulG